MALDRTAEELSRSLQRVEEITALVLSDPDNGLFHLWLGQALERADAMLAGRDEAFTRYGGEPGYLPYRNVGEVIRPARETDDVPAWYRQLRQAFAISAETVQERPGDAMALDVMSRVCLHLGYRAEAIQFARLATAADPYAGPSQVSLAWAYHAEWHLHEASRAATAAVELGCSLGYQILNAMSPTPVGTATPADVEAYYGPVPRRPTPAETATLLAAVQ